MAKIADYVKIIKTSMVAPAIPTERHRMFLSNLDLYWLSVDNVQNLLFYRISPQNECSSVAEKLRESLSSALVHFYPLAGRIDKGESSRVEIHCNDEGVQFVEASINISFEDVEKDDFHHKPFYQNLVSMAHQQNNSAPLLSVQVTAFGGGGGICIGVTFHHVIADGNSFWHFMKSWAESSRGLLLSDPPLHKRAFFKRQSKSPVPVSLRVQEIANGRITGAKIFKYVDGDAEPEVQESITVSRADTEKRKESIRKWSDDGRGAVYATFHFTEEVIRKLKERSGAKSSFVAVASHFWRCVVRARNVPPAEPVSFLVLTDCRGRVQPRLPQSYFGNCLCPGLIRTTAHKLQSQDGLFNATGLIQEVINYCTKEVHINNMMGWLESLESPDQGSDAIYSEFLKHVGSNVASSPRFPVYEVDFGWGRPLNVQVASINEVGGMVLFGEREGGGMAVSTRLPPYQMEIFRRLLSFEEI